METDIQFCLFLFGTVENKSIQLTIHKMQDSRDLSSILLAANDNASTLVAKDHQ